MHKAYANYCHTADKMLLEEYDSFYENNRFWLDDYALFMACKEVHNGQSWLEWEEEYYPSKLFVKELENSLFCKEIRYHQFVQFIFFKEWYSLKEYANKKDSDYRGHSDFCLSGQRRCMGKSRVVPVGQ